MNALGLAVGVATEGCESTSNIFIKNLDGATPRLLPFLRMTAATFALALFVSLFSAWSIPPRAFWFLILAITPLEITRAWCVTRAVQISPLSIIGPLTSFTSLFLIPIGLVVLGEVPTLLGIAGVLAIVAGSLMLGWKQGERLLSGWNNLTRERGVYLALAGVLAGSFAISATKRAFQYAPPLLTAFYVTAVLALVLSPVAYMQSRKTITLRIPPLIALWVIASASIALHNTGLSLMQASAFISLKRLSMLFDVFSGKVIFNEEYARERFIGAALMVVGVILIALG